VAIEDDLATLAVLQDSVNVRENVGEFREGGNSGPTPVQMSTSGDGELLRKWSGYALPSSYLGLTTKTAATGTFGFKVIQRFGSALNYKYYTSLLRKQAARLSKLSFVEALTLRFGLVVSFLALLIFESIDVILRGANYISARGFRRSRY
jgi:hypothetical protein